MFKSLKNYTLATPALLALMIAGNGLTAVSANANEVPKVDSNEALINQISEYNQTEGMGQVTSVSQLRDVSPTDWAFEALRNLVERYGCIVGYPDRTFRGNRALSRYEFAAGLNACMQSLERLIAEGGGISNEDLEKLNRLVNEFQSELAALGARVDKLEGRVAFLEERQFSTTTKLRGEAIIAVVAQDHTSTQGKWERFYRPKFGPDVVDAEGRQRIDSQATMSNRVRLTLDSSFTGKDLLRTRLEAGNIPNLRNALGTSMARLNFENGGASAENNVALDRLFYRTKLGDNLTFWVGTEMPIEEIYKSYSPYTESSGTGSLSRFLRYNPFIYRQPGRAGVAFKYDFGSGFDITASYLAANANDPVRGRGLFDGTYSAGVQLGYNPTKNFGVSVAYMHSYFTEDNVSLTGGTGSVYTTSVANQIGAIGPLGRTGGFAGSDDPFNGAATTSENVGVQATWRIADKINIAGWFGYAHAEARSADRRGVQRRGNTTDLYNWAANVSFLDLGKEGAVLTLAGGQLPRAGKVDGTIGRDRGQSWIIEGQYNYPINDNISITPGIYAIFNPNNSRDTGDNTIVVGVLRTVFKF